MPLGATTLLTTSHQQCRSCTHAGSVHFVQNIGDGESAFLQLFDNPKAGTTLINRALVALPNNVVNAGFSQPINAFGLTANFPFYIVPNCLGYPSPSPS